MEKILLLPEKASEEVKELVGWETDGFMLDIPTYVFKN